MAEVRLNSERKIENENFKIKIGTTNKTNPIVVYVEGRAFISPQEEKEDYTRDISELKHKFSRAISKHISGSSLFDNKYILDFQVASKGISLNKKSFLSFQFLLRQNKENVHKLKEIKDLSENMITSIVSSLAENITEHNFVISKTKK